MGISLATGAGKTVIFTQLISRIPSPTPDATRTLVLAHRRELVEQAAKHCTRAYPEATVEVEMGNIHASGAADITVASVQSITSKDRLEKYDPARFKMVLVDEAHHIVAPNYLRTLEHFGLAQKQPESPTLVGVSATFGRFDGVALSSAIDEIVYHKDYVDMIGDKWLSDVVFTTVKTSVDLSRVKSNTSGDFISNELSKAVNVNTMHEITVRTWRAKAEAAGRKSTLVFCVDVAHIIGLTNWFRQSGIDARFVTGETAKVERSETLEAFRKGHFPVLINCGVFTEGTDIPNIDCIVLARPTRSRNLLVQMIGRGMRLHHSKTNCHIIDLVSSLSTGIVTTPTLFGLDPDAAVDDVTVEELRAKAKEANEARSGGGGKLDIDDDDSSAADRERARIDAANAAYNEFDPKSLDNTRISFTDYATVFDLISDTSGERHIRAISSHAWVSVDRDKYVLCNSDKSYVRLEYDASNAAAPYRAEYLQALPATALSKTKAPLAPPREILRSRTFVDAVHGCDAFARNKFPYWLIARGMKWRSGPATQGQVDFLNKIHATQEPRNGGVREKLTIDTVSKGQAMDMITKIRHGARGRFTQIKTEVKRRETRELKEEKKKIKKNAEKVKVGPVKLLY